MSADKSRAPGADPFGAVLPTLRQLAQDGSSTALAELSGIAESEADRLREWGMAEATRLGERKDADKVAVGTWLETEMARLRSEAAARMEAVEHAHTEALEKMIGRVEAAIASIASGVAEYRDALDTHFASLTKETDPGAILTLINTRPSAPVLEATIPPYDPAVETPAVVESPVQQPIVEAPVPLVVVSPAPEAVPAVEPALTSAIDPIRERLASLRMTIPAEPVRRPEPASKTPKRKAQPAPETTAPAIATEIVVEPAPVAEAPVATPAPKPVEHMFVGDRVAACESCGLAYHNGIHPKYAVAPDAASAPEPAPEVAPVGGPEAVVEPEPAIEPVLAIEPEPAPEPVVDLPEADLLDLDSILMMGLEDTEAVPTAPSVEPAIPLAPAAPVAEPEPSAPAAAAETASESAAPDPDADFDLNFDEIVTPALPSIPAPAHSAPRTPGETPLPVAEKKGRFGFLRATKPQPTKEPAGPQTRLVVLGLDDIRDQRAFANGCVSAIDGVRGAKLSNEAGTIIVTVDHDADVDLATALTMQPGFTVTVEATEEACLTVRVVVDDRLA